MTAAHPASAARPIAGAAENTPVGALESAAERTLLGAIESAERTLLGALESAAAGALIGAIKLYQVTLSPWLGRQCRYEPTCSRYAEEALRRFGVRRGVVLAVRRIGRCHPWGGSGYDPVPEEPPHPKGKPED